MKPLSALLIFAPLLSGLVCAINDPLPEWNWKNMQEALSQLSECKTDITGRLAKLDAPLKKVEDLVAIWERTSDITQKEVHPILLRHFIRDNGKIFTLLNEDLERVKATKGEFPGSKGLTEDLKIGLNMADTILDRYCQSMAPPTECHDVEEEKKMFKEYEKQASRDMRYKMYLIQSHERIPYNILDELKQLVKRNPTNAEWVQFIKAHITGSQESKKPKGTLKRGEMMSGWYNVMKWQKFQSTNFAGWGVSPPSPDQPEAQKRLEKHLTWVYHQSMLMAFAKTFGKGLPDAMALEDSEILDAVAANAQGQNPGVTKEDLLKKLGELKNSPEREGRFNIKKTKGIDAKTLKTIIAPIADEYIRDGAIPWEKLDIVLAAFSKAYDPKLHPGEQNSMISNYLRKCLDMPVRRTHPKQINMNNPQDAT